MQNHLKDKKKCILRLLIVINNRFVQILPLTQFNTIYWTYPMQQNKYPWRDLKKKQGLKFVTVLTFYLVMWSLKLNNKDLIGC